MNTVQATNGAGGVHPAAMAMVCPQLSNPKVFANRYPILCTSIAAIDDPNNGSGRRLYTVVGGKRGWTVFQVPSTP